MFGYKGFSKKMYNLYKNFEGKVFECENTVLGKIGFHFFDTPITALNNFNLKTDRYALIEALGNVEYTGDKLTTNKILIIKFLTREELLCECDNNTVYHVFTGEYHIKNRVLHRDDGPAIINDEMSVWFQNGLIHRDDGPAITFVNKTSMWFQNGLLHRDHEPAIITYNRNKYWFQNGKCGNNTKNIPHAIINGDQEWYLNGKLGRDNDLPSIIRKNGNQEWYINGKLGRDNDLPSIIRKNGNQEWYLNGRLHRDNDQPAIVNDYVKKWYINGLIHRDDEPAAIYDNGDQEWYDNGNLYLEYFIESDENQYSYKDEDNNFEEQ